ncbi:11860_t:CDS:2 [Funneliformis mosseae]|uniref:11860_t:CDS:1 n=1 Tax=Funneliformis mosseae TaxID=27381 RepID=A0A9N9GTJ3_FUNMO|nr:11860_t:CDS:2 [Funneliformis mosseae]
MIQDTKIKDTNYYIDWLDSPNIEEYEHSFFEDIRPIGKGSFGSVVRVNLKNTDDLYALKSLNTDKVTLHEIVNEYCICAQVKDTSKSSPS